jgi:hypothetical protein
MVRPEQTGPHSDESPTPEVDWLMVWGRQARQWFAFQLFMLPGGAMAFGLPYIWERLRGSQTAADYLVLIMIWVPFCLLTNLWVPLLRVHRLRRLHRGGRLQEAEVMADYGRWAALDGTIRVRLEPGDGRRGGERWCTGLPEQIRGLHAGQHVDVLVSRWPPRMLRFLYGPTACLPLWDFGKEA